MGNQSHRRFKTKGVTCPYCKISTVLKWYNPVGIYRGYCRGCGYLIYSRQQSDDEELHKSWKVWINPQRRTVVKKARGKA